MGQRRLTVYASPAQLRVLRALLIDGCDNETIARRVGCGVQTVKTHLKWWYRVTGCPDRASLCVAVLREHVVPQVIVGPPMDVLV